MRFSRRVLFVLGTRLAAPWLPPSFALPSTGALWGAGVGTSGVCWAQVSGVSLQLKSKWDESIFTKGCIQALEGWLPRNIYIVAGVFIAISLLQVRSPCPLWLPLSLWAVPVRLSQILGLERLWWPGSEQAGSWLPGERVGESRELSASEKPGVPRGAQGLGRDAGSSQVASGAAAAPVWKVHCLENVWL